MKLRHFLTGFAALLTLAFSGCGKSAADEQVAVENFKKEADGLGVWVKEKQRTIGANPAAGMAMMKEMVAKMKAMKSDDLPSDLKSAWQDFLSKLAKMETLLAEIGSDPAEMIKKVTADPKFMQTFGERMKALEAEIRPAAVRLTEVGKKYGLEKIGELSPK